MKSDTNLTGTIVGGRYRVERVLGAGGVGSVYRATTVHDGQPVALKLLHDADDERFEREARVVASLRHPCIVRLVDFGTDPALDVRFLVMELVGGETLEDLMKRSGKLSLPFALHVTYWLASALAEAHTSGVVHRDIKPANVMMRQVGTEVRPVILDFGLARSAQSDFHTLTQDGEIFGTPSYMSPEQAKNAHVGPSTDMYALGTMLFEMLTGELPLDGPTPMAIMLARLRQDPKPINNVLPPGQQVPPRVEALVASLLEREPEARLSSANELVERVAALIDLRHDALSAEVTNPLPPRDHSPNAESRRRSTDLALTTVSVVLVGGLFFGTVWFFLSSNDEVPPATAPPIVVATETPKTPPPPVVFDAAVAAVVSVDAGTDQNDTARQDTRPAELPPYASAGCTKYSPAGLQTFSLTHERRTHPWWMYVPPIYDPRRPLPVVVHFPRRFRNGPDALEARGFKPIADEEGLLLLAVEGITANRKVDETAFARTALRLAEERFCIDRRRVYALGVSRGEWRAQLSSAYFPVSAIAGSGHRARDRNLHKKFIEEPPPYIQLAPLNDPQTPVEGIAQKTVCIGAPVASLDDHLAAWKSTYECSGPDVEYLSRSDGTCTTWSCRENPFVFCKVPGGAEWPGEAAFPVCAGPRSTFPYAETIWEFFQKEGKLIEVEPLQR